MPKTFHLEHPVTAMLLLFGELPIEVRLEQLEAGYTEIEVFETNELSFLGWGRPPKSHKVRGASSVYGTISSVPKDFNSLSSFSKDLEEGKYPFDLIANGLYVTTPPTKAGGL